MISANPDPEVLAPPHSLMARDLIPYGDATTSHSYSHNSDRHSHNHNHNHNHNHSHLKPPSMAQKTSANNGLHNNYSSHTHSNHSQGYHQRSPLSPSLSTLLSSTTIPIPRRSNVKNKMNRLAQEPTTASSSVSSTGSYSGNEDNLSSTSTSTSRSTSTVRREHRSRTHRKYNRFLSAESYDNQESTTPPSSVSPELSAVQKKTTTSPVSSSSSKANPSQNCITHTTTDKIKSRSMSSTKGITKARSRNNNFETAKFTSDSTLSFKNSLSLLSEDELFFNDQDYNGDSENGQYTNKNKDYFSRFSTAFRQRSVSPASSLCSSVFGQESNTLILEEDSHHDGDEEVEDFDIENEEDYLKSYFLLSPSCQDSLCSAFLQHSPNDRLASLPVTPKLSPSNSSTSLNSDYQPQRSSSIKRISRKTRQPVHYSHQHPLTNSSTLENDFYDSKEDYLESCKYRHGSISPQRRSLSPFTRTNLYLSSDERGYLASDSNYESLFEDEGEEEEEGKEGEEEASENQAKSNEYKFIEERLVRLNNFQRPDTISLSESDTPTITIGKCQDLLSGTPLSLSPPLETLLPSSSKVPTPDAPKLVLEDVHHNSHTTLNPSSSDIALVSPSLRNNAGFDISNSLQKSRNLLADQKGIVTAPKKSLVSNFTASIRALTQAASSLSNSQTSTMLLAFSPRSTDEHLPKYDTTTPVILNEDDETEEEFGQTEMDKILISGVDGTGPALSLNSSSYSSDEILAIPRKTSKPKSIPLTTYKFVSTPLPNPLPARPREPRLNPAFLRIYAIETTMRNNGKLEANQESIGNSRAFKTMILPARTNKKSVTGQTITEGDSTDTGFVRKCFFTGFDLGGERWGKKSGSSRQRVKLLFDYRDME